MVLLMRWRERCPVRPWSAAADASSCTAASAAVRRTCIDVRSVPPLCYRGETTEVRRSVVLCGKTYYGAHFGIDYCFFVFADIGERALRCGYREHPLAAGSYDGATTARSVTDRTPGAVTSTYLTQDAYVQTLPKQIQAQVAGRGQPTLAAPSARQEMSILTLPKQIQAQVAGRANQTEAVAAVQHEADVLTLPSQIQDDVRRALGTRNK